jgi:hypoxanthine phosphoribosyltransferase
MSEQEARGSYSLKGVISANDIQAKVVELGQRITADYQGKELLVIGILKGSVMFMSDLIRQIDLPLAISFMSVSSYGSGVASSGSVRLNYDLDTHLKNKHVLVVEDIIDSGHTISFLLNTLSLRQPASLKVCTLLDKPDRRQVAELKVDYTGFEIEDKFVVGYGMDYDGKHRNLGEIVEVEFDV